MKGYVWYAFLLGICFFVGLFILFQYNFFMFRDEKKDELPVLKKEFEFVMDTKNIRKEVLENGMTVLVLKNPAVPKVLLQIAYDVGSWVEEAGERGLAHLIEHMIFKGTNKLSERDIESIARKYGATFNAFTGYDVTSYYFEVNKNNWEPFVDILSDCMENARFDSQHLASEFKAVMQELKMYKDRHWHFMVEKAFDLAYPSNHPYHFPIIGYKEDLVSVTAENLKRFYNKYYRPERATLFVVGDIDMDDAIEIAKRNFAHIKPPSDNLIPYEKLKKDKFPDTFEGLVKNHTSVYEDVKKEQLGFYWTIPGLKAKNDILTTVVEFVIGGGEGSRLYRRLVEEEQVANSVSAMSYQLIESGLFFILVEPIDGKASVCEALINEELQKIIKEGVSDFELSKVVFSKRREFFQRFQSLSSLTYEWLQSFFATKNELDLFDKVNQFEKITSQDIQHFVKEYLDGFMMNRVEVLPLPEGKRGAWEKAKELSEKIDLEILRQHPRTVAVEEPKYVHTLQDPKKLDFVYPKPDTEFVLDNGLTVILKKNGHWPILHMNCKFKNASFLSESKQGQLVDFMMSNLMEGCGSYSKKENVDFFEHVGATYMFSGAGGVVSCLSDVYEPVFKRFFCILEKPNFPKQEFEKLKNIYFDALERKKDSSVDIANRILKNAVYKGHQYEWTFDDIISQIKNASISDLKKLHKTYVNPANMIVSVVGNFNLQEMEQKIKDVFGQWKKGTAPEKTEQKRMFEPGKTIDTFMLRDQVVLLMGRPSDVDIYHKDLVPLKILNFISFDSLGSRLYQLRERTGLFYAAFGAFAAGASREKGLDYLGAILTLDKIEFAKKELANIIDDIGSKGVLDHELSAARQQYLKGLIDLTSSNETIGAMLSSLKSFELGFDYYDKVLKQVQTISLEALNDVAKKYFVSKGMTTVRVGRVGKN